MQEYSCYSVISPEGCASILYRDRSPENVARAAAALRLTARELHEFGVVDEVIPEPRGGAHRNPRRAGDIVERSIAKHLAEIRAQSLDTLMTCRYEKYRRLGRYVE
jgi:acetyl-CoA carboxylase carboxyl transferase subunit alpha